MLGIDFCSKIFGMFRQIKVRSESAGQSLGDFFFISWFMDPPTQIFAI